MKWMNTQLKKLLFVFVRGDWGLFEAKIFWFVVGGASVVHRFLLGHGIILNGGDDCLRVVER